MSRVISEILSLPELAFFHRIEELERLSGRPGVDIKLASELGMLFKEKAGILGLDESDTTSKELYFGMSRLVLEHSDELARAIGVEAKDSPRRMMEKCIKFIEKRIGNRTVWSLKSSIARKQLKDNPPKKLMKIFGIRSMDSALKRERASVFYCFVKFVESPSWLSKYASQAGKLTNSDFDNTRISIGIIPEKRREQLVKSGVNLTQIVYSDQETAAVELSPPEKRFKGDTLFIVDSLLMQIKNMLRRSAYYKHQGLRPDFFSKVELIRKNGFHTVETANQPFDWPTIIHASAELGIPDLLRSHEPLISAEELLIPSTAQLGGFDFWKHPFGTYKDGTVIISFNLSDMIVNAINGISPEQAYIDNGRASLKKELFGRYLGYEPLRRMANNPEEAEG
jgi:hypothetical protein